MTNALDFVKSLKPGDVIETVTADGPRRGRLVRWINGGKKYMEFQSLDFPGESVQCTVYQIAGQRGMRRIGRYICRVPLLLRWLTFGTWQHIYIPYRRS